MTKAIKNAGNRKTTERDKFIGERIRQARIERGMSQADLGEALGVTFQQVQKYEKGVNRLSGHRFEQLTFVLERPLDYFFSNASRKGGMSPEVSKFLTMKEGVKIAKAFPMVPEQSRALVVHLVQKLAAQ